MRKDQFFYLRVADGFNFQDKVVVMRGDMDNGDNFGGTKNHLQLLAKARFRGSFVNLAGLGDLGASRLRNGVVVAALFVDKVEIAAVAVDGIAQVFVFEFKCYFLLLRSAYQIESIRLASKWTGRKRVRRLGGRHSSNSGWGCHLCHLLLT